MEQEILSSSKQKKGDNRMIPNNEMEILFKREIIDELNLYDISDISDIRDWYNQGSCPIHEKREIKRKDYSGSYILSFETIDINVNLIILTMKDFVDKGKYDPDFNGSAYRYVSTIYLKDALDYVYASKLLERIKYEDLIGKD